MESLNTLDTMANDLLLKMPEILEKGIEYGGDLAVRFVTFSIIIESLWILLPFLLIYPTYRVWKWANRFHEFDYYAVATVASAPFALALMACAESIYSIVQLLYVPELYILDYFK